MPKTNQPSSPTTPKAALQAWATANRITPADFSRAMTYSYNHAYQLLRGDAPITDEMLGRFVLAYGFEAAAPLRSSLLSVLAIA